MSEAIDPYSPAEIAKLVENIGIKKANTPLLPLFTLGLLAGAFIAFGAMFYTLVISGSELGFGPTKLLGGIAFSLGLILVVIAGAELFTGNNLIVIAWAEGQVSSTALLRNWSVVYIANFIGAVGSAYLVYLSGIIDSTHSEVYKNVISIAQSKIELDFVPALVRGILCNALVCLAVWLCFASHRVSGKVLVIIFPISAFVTLGFEHSVANMYFIPLGMMFEPQQITVSLFMNNLLPVTIGNILGGSVFVAATYWLSYIYGRK